MIMPAARFCRIPVAPDGELRGLSMDVAVAVSALSTALYLHGDVEVLAAARRLVAEVQQVEEKVEPFRRPWVSERTREHFAALVEFLAAAP
ncbi:hypothetical protein [Streptosporangium roseum]|uniref:Uncharacterized protein n=1 Tax=Streptosporangium roseum (strain ATCC 12428 / DSM 43021 / JCM 3005 / KCTC 9067 / NCIMB 10171 / NRRL 2505 / NI 9100) TaxID=479432 RepID=D2BAQ0_STRRD|nr:hypothetical protein [Streptosporangium roseum]ACZ89880.1 hypothetical protein Sros_7189 [Streptosporangium roseum DSM 43021]